MWKVTSPLPSARMVYCSSHALILIDSQSLVFLVGRLKWQISARQKTSLLAAHIPQENTVIYRRTRTTPDGKTKKSNLSRYTIDERHTTLIRNNRSYSGADAPFAFKLSAKRLNKRIIGKGQQTRRGTEKKY